MLTLSTITLLINSLTLSLTLGFLIIILWHDASKRVNQFFVAFLVLVILWNIGSFAVQFTVLTDLDVFPALFAINLTEIGFVGAGVTVYMLTTVLVSVQTRRFRILAFSGLILMLVARVFRIINSPDSLQEITTNTLFYQPDILFILLFDLLTLYLIWFYRRKFRSTSLALGITIFILGHSLSFVNPEFVISSLSSSVGDIGVLIIGFALLHVEIIAPLAERSTQITSLHRVSLAVISRLSLAMVLDEIAQQATDWLDADGAVIFLVREGNILELVNVYNMPSQLLNTQFDSEQSIAGKVVRESKSLHIRNYGQDWKGKEEFPLASETFGSVICVPLIYAGDTIGVLMVIAGKQGRLFEEGDVELLELLGAQVAVAISHSQLFGEQRALTQQLEDAHNQLSTVLESTENPVIAVDRELKLIFANPATEKLFTSPSSDNQPIYELLPKNFLPDNPKKVLRDIKQTSSFVYEVVIENKVYLCHIAQLGDVRTEGWVAVLNDITELKELDRLKSEMVRMASHDLKNPLMGAFAYVDLLREDLTGSENREAQRAITIIERQLERMNRIIRGVLDVERVRTMVMLTDVCDPRVVVEHAINELDYMIADRGVKISIKMPSKPRHFLGDKEQFERVLVNLIENSIKFSLDKPMVSITVYDELDDIVFKIEDNGVGIPESLHDNIFDRFYRGNQSGVEHITGSGLGLSLVKMIVENHQGKILVESEEGIGTSFFILIPSLNK